ncbi:MAG: biosis protein MshO [Burkholderiales bacterium]|jgi:MSHA biogenesis protein MshO
MPKTMTGSQRGFTLAEAVIVIAITGIVAATVAIFIRLPVQGYLDSAARAELTDTADTALRRISRDIRLAVPNSVRVSSAGGVDYIEFLLANTGGRYLAEEDNPTDPVARPFLSFDNPAQTSFTVVGGLAAGAQEIAVGNRIVVYNLGSGQAPADAYVGGNIATVSAVDTGNSRITLASNPFAAQVPVMSSPARRFDVVQTPVTYACNPAAGTLTRYWGYPISAAQPINAATAPLSNGQNALLARGVVGCTFAYSNPGNFRSGLVGVQLAMQTPGSASGTVVLFHQVHVKNTP